MQRKRSRETLFPQQVSQRNSEANIKEFFENIHDSRRRVVKDTITVDNRTMRRFTISRWPCLDMLEKNPSLLLEQQTVGEHGNVNGLQLTMRLGDTNACRRLMDAAGKEIYSQSPGIKQKEPLDTQYFDEIVKTILANRKDITAEITRHRNPDYQLTELGQKMDAFRKVCDEHGMMTPRDVANVFAALKRNTAYFRDEEVALILEYYDAQFDIAPTDEMTELLAKCNGINEKLFSYEEVNLFVLQVIGYVERLTPIWYRSILLYSVNNVVNNIQPFYSNDYLSDQERDQLESDLLNLVPNAGFGFDCAYDEERVRRHDKYCVGRSKNEYWVQYPIKTFEKFCRMNEAEMEEIAKCLQPEEVNSPRPGKF